VRGGTIDRVITVEWALFGYLAGVLSVLAAVLFLDMKRHNARWPVPKTEHKLKVLVELSIEGMGLIRQRVARRSATGRT
jgi:hypothetical protein